MSALPRDVSFGIVHVMRDIRGKGCMKLGPGDWVEVRSKEEILRSLDKQGCLDGLPFMPQMFQYCGQRFRVYKRAHKTCDTISHTGGRRLGNTVHLELRCDGEAYGGCQAGCLLFWKEAWLKPRLDEAARSADDSRISTGKECSEEDVWKATRAEDRVNEEIRYVCQATQLLNFTAPAPLRWWELGQYIEDYTSGNATTRRIFAALSYTIFRRLNWKFPTFRKVHDGLKERFGGVPFPHRVGTVPDGELTPTHVLDLQPGELVRVKSYSEILATLDKTNRNRGLYFDAELVPYCGGIYRVRTRVTQFVDEKSGKLRKMKTPAVVLENVWCQSRYSVCRMLCPRSIFSWWREIWLERVPDNKHEMT
jgi:hypothetical protein